MFSKEEVLKTILRIHREMNLGSYIEPKIVDVVYREDSDFLLIIAEDRPDKAAVLGPGGWALKRVRDELGIKQIAARTLNDIEIKRRRIKSAILRFLKVAKTLNEDLRALILTRIIPILKNELNYPKRELYEANPLPESAVIVAYSGGVDSTSALTVLKRAGLNPVSVTVDPGPRILPERVKSLIKAIVDKLDVPHRFIRGDKEAFEEIFRAGVEGRIHPCGSCSNQIMNSVLEFAEKVQIPVISSGDLLPTGSHSLHFLKEGYLKMNILAALAYSKIDSILLAQSIGYPKVNLTYGCPFIKALHKKHKSFRYASIQRVLREIRANILEPNQALQYIKSIIKS